MLTPMATSSKPPTLMIHLSYWEKTLPRNDEDRPMEIKTKEKPTIKAVARRSTLCLIFLSDRSL